MGDRRPSGPLTEDPVFTWVYVDDEGPSPDDLAIVEAREDEPFTMDSRYNKYHAKDGKFSSHNGGGAGTITVPIRDQNGVVLGSFELDRSKPMQPQVDAALKKLGMGGAKHSVVKDGPAAPAPAKKPAAKKPAATATAENKPEKVEGITTGDGKHVKVVDAKESTRYESPKNLTKDEKDAVYRYTDHGYEESNSLLRYGGWSKFPSTRKLQEEDIANIRSAIAKNTVKEDVLVHRMTNFEAFGFKHKLDESIVGTVVADKAFMSTTTNAEAMKGTPYSRNPVQLNIRVPKGTNALYLGGPGMSKWDDEKELLLGDGTKLAVLGMKSEGGIWQVDAQVVP